jgi:hypothetical protein
MPVLSQAACGSYSGPETASDGERDRHGDSDTWTPEDSEHAEHCAYAVSNGHQLRWTRHILIRELHALTGSMRLPFRVRERQHAGVICLPRLRTGKVAIEVTRS